MWSNRLVIISLILLYGSTSTSISIGASYEGDDWSVFEQRVRDGRVNLDDGQKAVTAWAERLAKEFSENDFGNRLFFPLKGYSLSCFGGNHGEGYKPSGYSFLDGNKHKGHPAQDIFIFDGDRDCLDDRTGKPVEVLSITDGVVMSTFSAWRNENPVRNIRGGNYIWIYHPAVGVFSYYAHLQEILVYSRERVSGGARIATLGRSGKNAYSSSSPTHLHIMLLMANGMTPITLYELLKARNSWNSLEKESNKP